MTHITSTPAFRRASASDAQALAALGAATFTETFGHLYPPQDLQSFLDESHTAQAWTQKLTDPHRATWLATLDAAAVGFIIVGSCKLPVENLQPMAGEIQQLYVLARHQNLRLGTQLMSFGMAWLEAAGYAPLYVGVWSENFGAQRFYGRYGFGKVGEYGFPVGGTVDSEFILRRGAGRVAAEPQ